MTNHFEGENEASAPIVRVPTKPGSRKLAVGIGIAMILLGVVIAVVGGTFIVRSRAGRGAYRLVVPPELPLVPGDVVRFERGGVRCTTHVEDVLASGNVRIAACAAGEGAIEVPRANLDLAAYHAPRDLPAVSDVVLVRLGAGWDRALVVAVEPNESVRIRPIRVAPNALAPAAPERSLSFEDAFPVARRRDAPVDVAVGARPVTNPGAAAVVRIARPFDALPPGTRIFVPTWEGSFERLDVERTTNDRGEVCARVESGSSPCREVPIAGVAFEPPRATPNSP